MKKSNAVMVYGIVSICALFIANILNAISTICLIVEQIKTGWGYGTNLEIGVLWPWTIEILCIPLIILGIVYLIIYFFKHSNIEDFIANIVLVLILLLQYFITNLFIWF